MSPPSAKYLAWSVVIAAIGLWVGLNVVSLLSYPAPYVDEGWFGALGYQFLTHHNFGLPTHFDVDGSSQNWVHAGRLYIAGMASFLKAAGVGLAQARLFTLLGGAVTGWLVYRAGERTTGQWTGFIAAALALFGWRAFYANHLVRPEPWVTAAGAGTLYLTLLASHSQRARVWFALGTVATVALDIHVTALHYLLAAGLIAVRCNILDRTRWPALAGFGLGVIAGGGYVLFARLFPDPALAIRQWFQAWGIVDAVQSGRVSLPLQIKSAVLILWSASWGATRLGFIEVTCTLAAVIVLALWRTGHHETLLIVLSSMIVSFVFLQVGATARHTSIFIPINGLLIAEAAVVMATALQARTGGWALNRQAIAFGLGLPLLLSYAAGDVSLAWQSRLVDYPRYAEALRQLVPSGTNVMAEEFWFFDFSDGAFTTDFVLTADPRMEGLDNDRRLEEIIRQRRIQFVLTDEQLAQDFSGVPLPEPERDALVRYVSRNCRLIGKVSGYLYGVELGGPRIRTTQVYDCR